ncbi:filamentous hemagglutinin N-terminal domain-containing protein [Erwinia sp. SLM-02]|uniref:filamentous hemagglutinin N-terminal domain-containing protein n=1 Tax=Erwinia sp. SLM-02 TaxID=3020057 RepID=UPI0030805F88
MLSVKIVHYGYRNRKIAKFFKVAPVCLMTWVTLGGLFSSEAAVIADPAMANQPGIHANATGPTIVDINAAAQNGISHNQFTEFNVNKNGLILNNSVGDATTTLGGKIAGNSNLSNGSANIIINEVVSKNMTQLNGMIEVAGKKAKVIIASPSGITCDGCGFINAERGILTTGKFDATDEPKFSVSEGSILLKGDGLQDSSDYTALIAQTISVVAEENSANDLTLMAGDRSDVIDVDGVLQRVASGDESTSLVGIDVAKLGGMYADKITLVAGQKGVSIKNSGIISADTDLVIQNNGAIRNTGEISSGNNMIIEADDINNRRGTLTAGGNFTSHSTRFENKSGQILAEGATDITASASLNNYHGTLSAAEINIKAGSINNAGKGKNRTSLSDKKSEIVAKQGDVTIVSEREMMLGDGGAQIAAAQGTVSLSAGEGLDIHATEINAKNIIINAAYADSPTVNGLDGTLIKAENDVNMTLGSLAAITSDSVISAGNDVNMNINSQGDAFRNLNNLGTLSAGNDLTFKSAGVFSNYGDVKAGKTANITSGDFINFSNVSGNLIGISSSRGFNNRESGLISSKTGITLSAKSLFRNSGSISSVNGTKVFSNFYRNDGKITGKVDVLPNN